MRKSASDLSIVGEKQTDRQTNMLHLATCSLMTHSFSLVFVKCWSYKETPPCMSGIALVLRFPIGCGERGQAEISEEALP